jgi:zinc/manganese transport system permease protein
MMPYFVELFGLPLLACLAMVAVLGYLGIHVLAREIVFIDIAVAQIAAVGAIAGHLAFEVRGETLAGHALPLGATILAAAFYAIVRRRVHEIPLEAVIGISYAVATAAALFLLGVAPGGHVHVQHMLAGSILWTSWTDLGVCAAAFSGVGLVFFVCRGPFHRISVDYDAAVAHRSRVVLWDFVFYSLVGVVVTVSVRIGGVVLVFAYLIMPATLAALTARSLLGRVLIAWGAGLIAAVAGLLFADRLDFSVGPSVALFLGATLALGALLRVRPGIAIGAMSLILIGLIGLGFAPPGGSGLTATPAGEEGGTGSDPCVLDRSDGRAPEPTGPGSEIAGPEDLEARIESSRSAQTLCKLFKRATEPDLECRIVCRVLRLDPSTGVLLALEYLESDPPFYFRQTAVDALIEVEKKAAELDVMKPFAAPENARVATAIREKYRRPR